MNIKEHILAAVDTSVQAIEIPEWACTLYIRSWTGKERNSILKYKDDPDKLYQKVLVLSIADESGKAVFSDQDAEAIMGKNTAVLERIVLAAMKHNGIGALETAKKN